MNEKENEKEKEKAKAMAKAVVYFDENGEVLYIEPGEGCIRVDLGSDKTLGDYLDYLINERKEKFFEVKNLSMVTAQSSPGCIIYIFGIPICICCG